MSAELVEHLFLPAFGNDAAGAELGDSAVLDVGGGRLAFSTDSFVVRPLFFPGGASATWPSTARSTTWRCRAPRRSCSRPRSSSRRALPLAEVGAGRRRHGRGGAARRRPARHRRHQGRRGRARRRRLRQHRRASAWSPTASTSGRTGPRPGDVVIVSGDIGVHGVAVMSCREGLEFGTESRSDSRAAARAGRGDAAPPAPTCTCCATPPAAAWRPSLNEIATAAGVGVELDERRCPIPAEVARRLRVARARPAVRRQRGQAAGVRARRRTPTRCSRRCARTRSGATPRSSASAWPSTRAWWSPGPASAARGWSTCRSASSCRGSADAPCRP